MASYTCPTRLLLLLGLSAALSACKGKEQAPKPAAPAAPASEIRQARALFSALPARFDLPGQPARAIARRAKARTESWLAERLAVARVSNPRERAREIMLLTEGSMALTLIHGGRGYIDAAARAAQQLVRQK